MKLNSKYGLKILFTALLILVLGISDRVYACATESREYAKSYIEMLEESQSIYLAMAKKSVLDGLQIVTTFEVLETIKGQPLRSFTLSNYSYGYEKDLWVRQMSSFTNHNNSEFWDESKRGRVSVMSDCSTFSVFQLGYSYLIFPEFKNNSRSAEIIIDESDKWLEYVRNKSKKGAKLIIP